MLSEGRRLDQPGIGHGVIVVEGGPDAVEAVAR